MTQTRRMSFVESCANVAIGYGVAVLANLAIFPAFGIRVSLADNLLIAGFFTVVSLVRGYCVRRAFNRIRA